MPPAISEDSGLRWSLLSGTNLAEQIAVAVAVEHGKVVSQRTGGDEAVHRGTDRETAASRGSLEIRCLDEKRFLHGRFDDRQGQHRIPSGSMCAFLAEALKDFLDYRTFFLKIEIPTDVSTRITACLFASAGHPPVCRQDSLLRGLIPPTREYASPAPA